MENKGILIVVSGFSGSGKRYDYEETVGEV